MAGFRWRSAFFASKRAGFVELLLLANAGDDIEQRPAIAVVHQRLGRREQTRAGLRGELLQLADAAAIFAVELKRRGEPRGTASLADSA